MALELTNALLDLMNRRAAVMRLSVAVSASGHIETGIEPE
jgi:hypothetical protein